LLAASVVSGFSWVMVAVFAMFHGHVEDVGMRPTDFSSKIILFSVTGAVATALAIALALQGARPRSRLWGSRVEAPDRDIRPH
jgi:hypothetical protein